jgi:hypothetical protein
MSDEKEIMAEFFFPKQVYQPAPADVIQEDSKMSMST